MGTTTKISWTDHTFNPWIGCTKVSPGCAHCYADAQFGATGRHARVTWGPGQPRSRTAAANWREPLKWNRLAAESAAFEHKGSWPISHRPRVFCASLADWLDDEVPIAWLADLLALIIQTPHLDWLLLTKRPQNWAPRLRAVLHHLPCDNISDSTLITILAQWLDGNDDGEARPLPNVWLGTSVEDQTRADERIPLLLNIPAKVRFLSCEPLLGPLNLEWHLPILNNHDGTWSVDHAVTRPERIDWVIAGGESGPNARPMHPAWARSLRDQCATAGAAFHFKQWGEWVPRAAGEHAAPSSNLHIFADPREGVYRVGKTAAGHLLDGVEHLAFPTVQP